MQTGTFQRTATAVSVNSTTQAAGFASVQINAGSFVQITSTATNGSAAFAFGATAVSTDRPITPGTTLFEYCPVAVNFVSVIALAAPGPTIIFTPGKLSPG